MIPRIGVIDCYAQTSEVAKLGYSLTSWMHHLLQRHNPKAKMPRRYGAPEGELPKRVDECDVYIISGSPCSVYEEQRWIQELAAFVRRCAKESSAARTKVLGVCFGHQMISYALGGRVQLAECGWGVGVRQFSVLDHDKSWMNPKVSQFNFIMSHQDQVVEAPTHSELLATSEFCPNEMLCVHADDRTPMFLSLQGHPEFPFKFSQQLYESRVQRIGEKLVREAVAQLGSEAEKVNQSADQISEWLHHWMRSPE